MEAGFRKIQIGGYVACIWVPEGTGPWPLFLLCGGDMEETLGGLVKEWKPNYVIFAPEADWDRDYTPWELLPAARSEERAEDCQKRYELRFVGKAGEYLDYLEHTALPCLEREIPIRRDAGSRAILGYSLGGLFALWAGCESGRFGMAASISGSLWYDGWVEYIETHSLPPDARVYLSLGKSEEHSSNEDMRRVGDCTRQTYQLLKDRLGEEQVMLEWNRGGHFTGIANRWKKALTWLDGSGPV